MTSFPLSARLLCILAAPTKRKMLIGVNEFGKKTKFRKTKHTLCLEVGAEFFFLEMFSLVFTSSCACGFDC